MQFCSDCHLPIHKDVTCVNALIKVLEALNKNLRGVTHGYRADQTVKELQDAIMRVLICAGENMVACRGCGSPVFWVKHANGKNTPYDQTGVNHFVTCPKSKDFRR